MDGSGATVLVVDDEPGILEILTLGLRGEGLTVVTASDVAGGLAALDEARPDLIVLDVGLPGGDGFSLLARIRETSDCPVIMLTARGDVADRVRGLEMGADDYVAKPFHLDEIIARIRARLRRHRPVDGTTDVIEAGPTGLTLDLRTRKATQQGKDIGLTAREFDLLRLLAERAGEVVGKAAILESVWGFGYDPNIVEVYVGYLRRKLGDATRIETVRGAGYLLVTDPAERAAP
jgi:DNA-binding response OmpR family regulator